MSSEQLARLVADAKRARSAYLGELPATLLGVLDAWACGLAQRRLARRRASMVAAPQVR